MPKIFGLLTKTDLRIIDLLNFFITIFLGVEDFLLTEITDRCKVSNYFLPVLNFASYAYTPLVVNIRELL